MMSVELEAREAYLCAQQPTVWMCLSSRASPALLTEDPLKLLCVCTQRCLGPRHCFRAQQ